jgi:hypothetical protein
MMKFFILLFILFFFFMDKIIDFLGLSITGFIVTVIVIIMIQTKTKKNIN